MRHVMERLEYRRLCAAGDQDLSYGENGFVRHDFADAAYQFMPGSDPTGTATVVAMSADGESFSLRRFINGVPDATAGVSGTIITISLPFDPGEGRSAQPSRIWNLSGGRTLIEFIVPTSSTAATGYFVRLNPDRTLDTTYSGDGVAAFGGGFPLVAEQQGDMLLAVTGGQTGRTLARYDEQLVLDPTFGGGDGVVHFPKSVRLLRLLPDGKILAALPGHPDTRVYQLTADGGIDTAFGGGDGLAIGPSVDALRGMTVDSAGRITLSGSNALTRFTPDGLLDATFGDAGRLVPFQGFHNYVGEALVEDAGMIAPFGGYSFIRIDGDGMYDADYGRVVVDLRQPERPVSSIDFADIFEVDQSLRGAQQAVAQPDGSVLVSRRFLDGSFAQVRIAAGGAQPSPVRLDGGILTVAGTDEADSIQLDPDSRGDVIAVVNGVGRAFALDDVTSYRVDAGGGDDTVVIDRFSGGRPAVVLGGDGDDRIAGGPGDDTLLGNAGHDRIDGGEGHDLLLGNGGRDKLSGSFGMPTFTVLHNDGNDRLFGGAGGDWLAGGDGDDILLAGIGDDYLEGAQGVDRLMGSDGNDLLFSRDGFIDDLYGGGGSDSVTGRDGDDLITDIETT